MAQIVIYKDPGLVVEVFDSQPPTDQTVLVDSLNARVAELTAQRDALHEGWGWYAGYRKYGQWSQFIYNTCCAVSKGRLLIGGADEGIVEVTQMQPGDPDGTGDAIVRGAREYLERGYLLTHGQRGFGHWGLPLPWGVSADIDEAMRFWGHTISGETT